MLASAQLRRQGLIGAATAIAVLGGIPAAKAVFRTVTATGALTFIDESFAPRRPDLMIGDPILVQVVFDDSMPEFSRGLARFPVDDVRVKINDQLEIDVNDGEIGGEVLFGSLGSGFGGGINAITFAGFNIGTDVHCNTGLCFPGSRSLEVHEDLELEEIDFTGDILLRGEFNQVAVSPD